MIENQPPLYYSEYLKLDKILDAQLPKSLEYEGKAAHDETLFIIVHQVYELWFKQILHELKSVMGIMSEDPVQESQLAQVTHCLERVVLIQRLLVDQLTVMESMTPMSFLEFRDYLIPASGFQSIQFREIEIMLGLKHEDRLKFAQYSFYNRLKPDDQKTLKQLEQQATLLDHVDNWLSRMPFTKKNDFNFWQKYRSSVQTMLESDQKVIEGHQLLKEDEKTFQLKNIELSRQSFDNLLDSKKYQQFREQGTRILSHDAKLNAIFITLYSDWPLLQLPHKFISLLIEIDENFTHWRYRHALMAHRLLGDKIGTGGSSGQKYLQSTAENNRVFIDLFNLSSYIIPKQLRPVLPEELKKDLDFKYGHGSY